MSIAFQRAQLLYQQSRYQAAAAELRKQLGDDPNDERAHAFLGLCLAHDEQFADAMSEVEQAIVLAPHSAYPHFCRSQVLSMRNRPEQAESSAREAIRLDPTSATHHGALAYSLLGQRKWQSAYDAAVTGLQHDPYDEACNDLRTIALTNLGRTDEAVSSVDDALARNPENAYAHSNKGWALLHQSKPKLALEQFREALRLDPSLDQARSGMVEALKARNPLYRFMLGYFLFMARLDKRVQWGIILGGYFGIRVLRGIEDANPDFSPWITPIIVAYITFAVMTWFAMPLTSLLLRLSPFGRHALSRDQLASSNWFGLCLLVAIVGTVGIFVDGAFLWAALAIFGVGLALPTTMIFYCDAGWPRNVMTAYTVFLGLIGVAMLVYEFAVWNANEADNSAAGPLPIFLLGVFASQFVANYLVSAEVRR